MASSLHANHPFLSVRGMTGNMQGFFVILSYLVVFFYSFFGVKKTENINKISSEAVANSSKGDTIKESRGNNIWQE